MLSRPKWFFRRHYIKFKIWLKNWVLRIAKNNLRFAGLYFLMEGSFDREFRSVLAGQLSHEEKDSTTSCNDASAFTLRRNVHRLEKGLLMQPRRNVFALDYINETVQAYRTCVLDSVDHSRLLQWATDVVDEYFNVVDRIAEVQRAKQEYSSSRVIPEDHPKNIPYLRDLSPLKTTIVEMQKLALRRRSVRWFEQRPVPREMIDQAVLVALQSPSACNRQPFHFRFFDKPDLVQKIAKIPMGMGGYDHNVPSLAVIIGQQRAYFSERDRHLIYIDGSLAAMSFMFALEVQGIASCPINWPDMAEREAEMANALALDEDERPIMLIAFGYPDPNGAVAFSQKKSLQEARSFNVAPGYNSIDSASTYTQKTEQ